MNTSLRSALPLLAIALIWTTEIALVQEYTIQPRFLDYLSWVGKHAVRWGVALCSTALILFLAGKRALVAIFVLHLLFSLTLLTYFEYYGFPLSEQVFITQATEGAHFGAFALTLISPTFAAALFALLFLKLYLLGPAKRMAAGISRKKSVLAALVGLLLCFAASWKLVPPLDTVASWGEQTLFAEAYGYLPSWAINAYHFRDEKTILENAVATSRPIDKTRLSAMEKLPGGARNIAIIQAESLDFSIIHKDTEEGLAITPFLRRLSEESMFYAVTPFRRYSTAGADFQMISGLLVDAVRIPYKIPGYPFSSVRTIARKAAEKGFKTAVLHGNYGYYYSRDKALPQCGFDRVLFQQDMEKMGIEPEKGYILDADCFALANTLMDGEKNLHFIITMTTHGPFNTHPDVCPLPYPYIKPDSIFDWYANSTSYLDYSLQLFIEGLPDDTLVFLYGDHGSGMKYDGVENGLVPFFIYMKGHNLAPLRTMPEKNALSGEVEYAEIVKLIHDYIENGDQSILP
ncbi:LTA synthase family protein [Desulfovibrio sp. OttesenSCG-928-G15]|nr:LTA synthase family protein [Desulfovibrio sp. OttesenSCG-928-G15]